MAATPFFFSMSPLCCLIFFSLCLFVNSTHTQTQTQHSSHYFLSSMSSSVSSSSRVVGSFSVELSAPQGAAGKQNGRTMQNSLSFGTQLVSAVNDFHFGPFRWLQPLCECTTVYNIYHYVPLYILYTIYHSISSCTYVLLYYKAIHPFLQNDWFRCCPLTVHAFEILAEMKDLCCICRLFLGLISGQNLHSFLARFTIFSTEAQFR